MNETHDPRLLSWVESANRPASDFPLQNLPWCSFRGADHAAAAYRAGIAIGDYLVDVGAALKQGLFQGAARQAAELAAQGPLNALMAAGHAAASALRLTLSRALRQGAAERAALEACLVPQSRVEFALPCEIGDYTDFYTSIHHATAVGKLFRPDQPLLPNYRWLPVGYHGRCSSIGVSPQHFRRPAGQRLEAGAAQPSVGRSERLDYELEVGVFIGRGNPLGSPIAIGDAERHVFGLCLLNDWSARDLQAFEYQPLGPFLGKNFATTLSPFIVTLEALEPYRVPWQRAASEPAPQPYLDDEAVRSAGAIDIQLEVWIETEGMRASGHGPVRLSHSNFRDAYWSIAHMVAHHTINGCNLRPGDLLGTGTQSGPTAPEAGSLLELTRGGREPLQLPNGERRGFLADGDEIILRAYCQRSDAARIGFGEARGRVLASAFRSVA